ncbi:FtsX-like permease family protein [Amycolatopsis aidingensis]|uniref:FtsX-like permease family protein n=1 Tax=Amycolatopsis aidingensis TaxID=2842453 RepID=UPI001C0C39E7|nr:FtsX-like permease family protein [Amycolatopsis aidingensis]
MLRLSVNTFRERWQLFIGAIITVCMGVALVQSSLLVLISVATAEPPPGLPPLARAQLENGNAAALAMLGVTLGLCTFLAVFIVSSTFAFTVAQRRRDLALFRLVGGGRGQVRRLLLSEALLLGVIGTGLGIPLGLLVMRVQSWLLAELGFVPAGFTAHWQDWILGVSGGVGVGVALAGVLVASGRAARVRPLEALRKTGAAARVMTWPRWFFGLLFLAGALAMAIVARFAGPEGAIPLSINAALAASVGLAALSPLVVPAMGALVGVLLRGSVLGGLAQANLRDGVRRSAATAAPLIVLVGLLIGQLGTMSSITEATERAQRQHTAGDLVVESTGPGQSRLSRVPGVELAATELQVPAAVITSTRDEGDVETDTENLRGAAVHPAAYQRTHLRGMAGGSLADLHGSTVAIRPMSAAGLGETVTVRFGEQERRLRVVAILPESMGGGPELLVPPEVVPPALLADAPAQTILRLAPGAAAGAVAAEIEAAGLGTVRTVPEWIARSTEEQQDTQAGVMTVVMGLGGLYALVAVINSVVIAAAERRPEFAVARVSGLRRGQVVRMALLESWTVTAIGLLLGGLAAAATLFGITAALERITGVAVFAVPWPLVGAVVLGAFAVVGVTSLWTTVSATRANPVSLVTASE